MQPWARPCLLLLCLQGGCAQLCRPPSWEPHVPTVFAGHQAEPTFPARRHSLLLCLHCGHVRPLHKAREDPQSVSWPSGGTQTFVLLPGEGTRGRSWCGLASEAQALLLRAAIQLPWEAAAAQQSCRVRSTCGLFHPHLSSFLLPSH